MTTITTRQKRAVAALLTSPSIVDAAKQSGISARTLSRWIDQPDFRSELKAAEADALTSVTRRLVSLAEEAVVTIQDVMSDCGTPPGVRLRAAEAVLENLLRLRDLVDLEARVSRLEREIT